MPLSKDYETCMRSEQSDLRQQMPRRMRVSTSNIFMSKYIQWLNQSMHAWAFWISSLKMMFIKKRTHPHSINIECVFVILYSSYILYYSLLKLYICTDTDIFIIKHYYHLLWSILYFRGVMFFPGPCSKYIHRNKGINYFKTTKNEKENTIKLLQS